MLYKSFLTILIVLIDQLKNGFTNCVPTLDHRINLRPPNPGDEEPLRTTSETYNPFMNTKNFNDTIEAFSPSMDYYPPWCPECCDEDEVYSKSLKKCLEKSFIMDECISSEQCVVPQSTCHFNVCRCTDYYYESGRYKCIPIHNTAIEIYKITMIFASSCLALILLIFLACILRKSYCPADSTHQATGRSTMNDLFTIYPGTSGSPSDLFGNLTPAEKPPSYSETMRMINQEIGTPPPAYHNIFYTEASSTETTLPHQILASLTRAK
uniref:EB domain-containing protein n=1 Tax=Tetranychus urticae TaxID=32264 RepID=T1KMP4_TETUR